jgi:hypothetical protein
MSIFLLNKSPVPDSRGNAETTAISVDVVGSTIFQNTILAYVDGVQAYNGSNFIYPFNASGSSITTTIAGGYDGYHLNIESLFSYDNFVSVRVHADNALSEHIYEAWSFLIDTKINTVYFSDGYGAKKINMKDLVGECQSKVRTFLSTTSTPSIPSNRISSMHGNLIDGYFCLAMSFDDVVYPEGYGVIVARNETNLNTFADGYSTYKGQITDDGKLYLINKDTNSIEVYYGVYFRSGLRSPDFIYNQYSTPAIMAGDILTLHIVSNVSTRYRYGTRLYVGTSNGVTRIEAYDKDSDGYCAGYDAYGVAITYSIPGGIGTHKVIGGTIPRVTSISSDEDKKLFMAVTQDGSGNGGVSQISLTTHKKVIYMTHEGGFLPSNDIRDIFGKGV